MYMHTQKKEMQAFDDRQLIERIQKRVRNTNDFIYELLCRHHDALLRRCYFFLKNQADAEDAVQETELRAFRAVQHFKGESSYRTWLFAIADNQCRTIADKRSKRLMNDHLIALIEMELKTQQKSEHAYHEYNDIKKVTASAVNAMPVQGREIINLRFYQDKGLDEISNILDLGLSATKMRLYRSIKQLSDSMSEEASSLYMSM